MTRILMVLALVGAILVPGLSPVLCARVQLDENTRNEGLLALIPFQLHGNVIVTENYRRKGG